MTEADTALAELTAISAQIEAAVLVGKDGAVSASTLTDERAASLASSARALLEGAEQVRDGELTQLEAATGEGSVFVVRDGDRLIAATAGPEPTAGLVFYDLRSALRRAAEPRKTKPKPRAKRPKTSGSS
jgi:predicted regulator of Ras-like GTPase activity (Roadblock/LC7/MglB family)